MFKKNYHPRPFFRTTNQLHADLETKIFRDENKDSKCSKKAKFVNSYSLSWTKLRAVMNSISLETRSLQLDLPDAQFSFKCNN
jgi:hypothetical protein